jgi:Trk K+ transport system NAD-binding subunit
VADTDLSRRVGLAIGGGVLMLSAYATVYRWGMTTFEGKNLSFVRSLQVVLEILTTAGFGGDAPWTSTGMNLLVIAMNLTGVSLVFFGIPFFLVPLLEDAIQRNVPTESSLSGHVIVCADSPRETPLRAELDEMDVDSLFVKEDEAVVRELLQEDIDVIHGDPETTETLERANVSAAQAIVIDVNDEQNASIILAARRVAPEIRVVSVVEDADTESYHKYAGADRVIRPRVAVGERLVTKIQRTQFHESVDGAGWAGELELTELLVENGSDLAGQTLSECQFRQRYGVTVLGGWFHGEFIAPVDPEQTLVEQTVLLVVGQTDELTTLKRDVTAQNPCERVIVAGYGVVGRTVTEALTERGIDVTVVDSEQKDGVDVVGDITEKETLREAGVQNADSIVLTLARDSLAVYSALVLAEHAPSVDVLARADDTDYVQKCYDAGTDFTLALSEVTAHMVTAQLFEQQTSDYETTHHEVARLRVPTLAGRKLGETAIRTETGAQIVAIERNDTLHANPDPTFEIRRSDTLLIAGTRSSIAAFESTYTTDEI